jgi:hypothetical protein
MSSPRAERCVGNPRNMHFLIKLVVLREQTGLILCLSVSRHEKTSYLQIISPDLSVTVFVTSHFCNFSPVPVADPELNPGLEALNYPEASTVNMSWCMREPGPRASSSKRRHSGCPL